MPCKYNTFDGRLLWFDGIEGKRGLTSTGLFVVVVLLLFCCCWVFFGGVGFVCCCCFLGGRRGSNCFIV